MKADVITMDQRLQNIIGALEELKNDVTVPKNIKIKITLMIEMLHNKSEDFVLQKDRVLSELDEITEDANLQAYTRTQIWNVVSALEMI